MSQTTEKFSGVRIYDSTGETYYTEINIKQNLTHKYTISTTQPINSQFPYFTRIGKASYWTGSVTASWEKNKDTECATDYEFGDVAYRLGFIDFMHNGLTKYLQLSENFILPVTILDEIQVETERSIDDQIMSITFNWTQCAKPIKSR